jgi:hypothetical protein
MGIDMGWIDENDELQSEIIGDSKELFANFLDSLNLEHSKCLSSIDAYGDTVFNQRQIPVLIEELKSKLKFAQSDDTRIHLHKLISLVEKSIGKTHTYIKFYGD